MGGDIRTRGWLNIFLSASFPGLGARISIKSLTRATLKINPF
jgi:hypothetical protein